MGIFDGILKAVAGPLVSGGLDIWEALLGIMPRRRRMRRLFRRG